MCPPSEPDNKLERLAVVFRDAVNRSSGPAKQKFVRLSNAFNAMLNLADRGAVEEIDGAKAEFNAAMDDVKEFARTNPAAQRVLLDLSRDIIRVEDEFSAAPASPQTSPPEKKKARRHWNI